MSDRPAVVTLLRGLYIWNRKPDWQAVSFGGYPHPFCHEWDQCRIMPVPTVARGACHLEGCHKCSACCFSVTAGRLHWNLVCSWGPISYSLCSNHGWGISARAHVQRYPPHRASVSRKRHGRLCSNLVCGLVVINYYGFQTICKCPFWALLVTMVTDSNQTCAN